MDVSYFSQILWLLLDGVRFFLVIWMCILIYYSFVPFIFIAGVFSFFYRRGASIRKTIIFTTISTPALAYLSMRYCSLKPWDPILSKEVLLLLAGTVLCIPLICITRIALSKNIKSNDIDSTVVMDMLFFIVSFTSLFAIFMFIAFLSAPPLFSPW